MPTHRLTSNTVAPPTSAASRQMGYCCRIFTPAQPVYPAASVRDFLSGAYTSARTKPIIEPRRAAVKNSGLLRWRLLSFDAR